MDSRSVQYGGKTAWEVKDSMMGRPGVPGPRRWRKPGLSSRRSFGARALCGNQMPKHATMEP
jgi:hypothetical protein